MRRTGIELWIAGTKADLSDDSFVLMNWTQEDLASPAIVKNSFSKQITLPGTPTNNNIFGCIFRSDRVTQYASGKQTGVYFDPTRKTDFAIYNERSEVVESGYLRLNNVNRRGSQIVEYKVTLYGGLGSFLYGLSYDENGDKRTIAGLNFMNSVVSADEFDFTLEADSIRAAWTRIAAANNALTQMWDFINFAPAYNGIPNGTFDAKKGVLDVVAAGLSDGTGTKNHLALVNMTEEYTEWMTRDLRSYLQRPALRLRGLIEAIAASRNNGGWTVNLDPAFFSTSNPYYNQAWLTLPIINTENIIATGGGQGTLTWQNVGSESYPRYEAVIPDFGADRDYVVNVLLNPQIATDQSGRLYLHAEENGGDTVWMSVIYYELSAYDENDDQIAYTSIYICSRQLPEGSTYPSMNYVNTFWGSNGVASWEGDPVPIQIAARGIKKVYLRPGRLAYHFNTDTYMYDDAMWTNPNDPNSNFRAGNLLLNEAQAASYQYNLFAGGRSGKAVKKSDILSGGGTPADYLLSFCKTFGLVIVADNATKTVSIDQRSTFYNNGSTVDLTDLVDISSVEKEPFAFSARWYVWDSGYDFGEWAKKYKEKYGKIFAQMRADTGFSFDANTTRVMEGNLLKGAVMALENGKYFCNVTDQGYPLPSVLLDRGAKFTIAVSETENEDVEITKPTESAAISWINVYNPTYDLFPKVQLHDDGNKAAEGRDVLLFFTGMTSVNGKGFALTDDTPFMIQANGGTPCWLLRWAARIPGTAVSTLPRFSRYIESSGAVQVSMDFGTPSELPVPGLTFADRSTIYDKYWKKYIADRYDDDSAVIRVKVNLRRFQVGAGLLRNFYWFDGAIWSLNKIINHSVTTDDLTECEFVKVQDVNNYKTL